MKKFSKDTYIARRRQLKRAIGQGRILLLGNNNSSINFKDNWYPFRQDSTFLYYFGLSIPGVHGLIDVDEDREIIFGNELSMDDIIWTGKVPKLVDLADEVGVTEVLPTIDLIRYMNESVQFLPPYRSEHAVFLSRLFNRKTWKVQKRFSKILIKAIAKQRLYKSDSEIAELDLAVKISNEMHREVMHKTRPGMKEHELVGIAASVLHRHNVSFAYSPILTRDGQILHNHHYGNTLAAGDMVLFDGGCESPAGYAGDITRTFPVSSEFTSLQRDLYTVVLHSFNRAVEALAPGVLFKEVHRLASVALVEGLIGLNIMKGDPDEAVANGAHTLFFQCGLGHLLGLDVHDMENLGEEKVGYTEKIKKEKEFGWKSLRLGRSLKPRFTITIEPGIYIIPELIDLRRSQGSYVDFVNYEKLNSMRDFGGIRIEDNFVVTKEGSRLLGDGLAITLTEVEAARKAG